MKRFFYILLFILPGFCFAQSSTGGMSYVKRPSDKPGRTYVQGSISTQTATATVYTVTGGKTLYVTGIMTDFYNSHLTNSGALNLQDNNTVPVPMLVPNAVAGQNQPMNGGDAINYSEPLQFTTSVKMAIITGAITYSFSFVGHEE